MKAAALLVSTFFLASQADAGYLFTPDQISGGATSSFFMAQPTREIVTVPAYFVGGGDCFIDSFWMQECVMTWKLSMENGKLTLTVSKRIKRTAADPARGMREHKGDPDVRAEEVQAASLENGAKDGARGSRYTHTSVKYLLKNGATMSVGNSEDNRYLITHFGNIALLSVDAGSYDTYQQRLLGAEEPIEIIRTSMPLEHLPNYVPERFQNR